MSEIDDALRAAIERLEALDLGDTFDPRAPAEVRSAGLHRLTVPREAGGLGAGMVDAARVLTALGAIDGSTALGFAMHVHVVGSVARSEAWPASARDRLHRAVVEGGALVNAAATEEGGGSPARGAVPGTLARGTSDGGWLLSGEKTWTTWLPALDLALVSARIDPADRAGPDGGSDAEAAAPEIGLFLVDLALPGIGRAPGFEAMGMRGSASGRLRLMDVALGPEALVVRRRANAPDPRGPTPPAWFALAIGATYLGVGEGARTRVARWAIDRRPGDGSTSVADVPSVQVRLGRLDAELRTARIVLFDAARRWDESAHAARAGVVGDLALAKLVATRAAAIATDEALRIAGGPGFLTGPLERAFRDARAGLINPPLEDVAYLGFARAVLDAERDRTAG
jgi:alkylation response protein AidB-like acyl-CoA dehydrogenase